MLSQHAVDGVDDAMRVDASCSKMPQLQFERGEDQADFLVGLAHHACQIVFALQPLTTHDHLVVADSSGPVVVNRAADVQVRRRHELLVKSPRERESALLHLAAPVCADATVGVDRHEAPVADRVRVDTARFRVDTARVRVDTARFLGGITPCSFHGLREIFVQRARAVVAGPGRHDHFGRDRKLDARIYYKLEIKGYGRDFIFSIFI